MIVGIDFGTCYSSISVMVGNKPDSTYVKDTTGLGIPTIYLYHNGDHFGEDCEIGSLREFRGNIIRKIKKEIREDPDNLENFYKVENFSLKYKYIVERFLKYLIDKLIVAVKNDSTFPGSTEIEEIAISAPVAISSNKMSYTDYREFLKSTLVKITGLDENLVHVIDEPAAAAISYLYQDGVDHGLKEPQTALVFDLGGGTLDVALVQHNPNNMSFEELVPPDGDLDLGGENWDNCLKEIVREKSIPSMPYFTSEQEIYDFDREITKAKSELSEFEEYDFELRANDEYYSAEITRKEFEERSKPLLERAISVMRKVLDQYPEGISKVDKIVLVGGSSLMPQIRERMIREFSHSKNEEDVLLYNPSKATANGAAIFAQMNHSTEYGEVFGDIVAKHTYGVTVRKGKKIKVCNIIYRGDSFNGNSYLIKEYPERIGTANPTALRIKFDIYESDHIFNPMDDDLMDVPPKSKLMTLYVPVPYEYSGSADKFRFSIEMKLTDEGILKVTARDIHTKNPIMSIKSR